MNTILLTDGENLKGKIKVVFKENHKEKLYLDEATALVAHQESFALLVGLPSTHFCRDA